MLDKDNILLIRMRDLQMKSTPNSSNTRDGSKSFPGTRENFGSEKLLPHPC